MNLNTEIRLPRLHPAQSQVKSEASRFNVLACGRRWGKTVLGLDLAIHSALDGHPVAWAAPSYKLLAEPFRTAQSLLSPIIKRISHEDHRIELATGGTIVFWTLNDINLGRGYKYKLWIIDEAAHSQNLQTAFEESIRPTLVDLCGDAWLLSSPQGQNYFHNLFLKGQSSDFPNYRSWQMPTTSNPHIRTQEIAEARDTLPERTFRQEFLAEFAQNKDTIFQNFHRNITSLPISEPNPNHTYIAGIDLAKVQDFTVVTILNDQGHQVYFDRFRRQTWSQVISRIITACQKFRAPAVIDATGLGDPIVEQLQSAGLTLFPFRFTSLSKEPLIQSLAVKMEQNKLSLLDVPEQTLELESFQAIETPGGGIKYSAPPGQHDDCVIALALAASKIGNSRLSVF